MLQVSKLFLLLITCVSLSLACTSSKRKSPTTPAAPIDQSNQSQQLEEMEDKLNKALSKIATLQSQTGKDGVSQDEFEEWQSKVKTAQDDLEAAQTELGKYKDSGGKDVSGVMDDLRDKIKELEDTIDKLTNGGGGKEKPTEGDGKNTGTGEEPVLRLSLVELSQEKQETIQSQTHTWQEGTYVTFHSDTDVVIETITYGELNFTPERDSSGKPFEASPTAFNIQLPVYVKFIHASTPYCVTATLNRNHLPGAGDQADNKVEMTSHTMKNQECKP